MVLYRMYLKFKSKLKAKNASDIQLNVCGPDGQLVTWCSECELNLPARSAHCSFCDVCVRGRDHHCIWYVPVLRVFSVLSENRTPTAHHHHHHKRTD